MMRMGRRHAPTYRLVAIDSRMRRDGRFIEILGHYNPRTGGEPEIKIREDRVAYWLGVGAQPSETVYSLLRRTGFLARMEERRREEYIKKLLEMKSLEAHEKAHPPEEKKE